MLTIYEFLQQQKKDMKHLIDYITTYSRDAITAAVEGEYTIEQSRLHFYSVTVQLLNCDGIQPAKWGASHVAYYNGKPYITSNAWCMYNTNGVVQAKPSDLSDLIDSILPTTELVASEKGLNKIGDVVILDADGYNCTGATPMWHLREYSRLHNGVYTPLPVEALALLTEEQRSILESYFPHLSKTPGLIAYTATPEKGLRDIQTPARPGKFLQKVFPGLDNEVIKEFAKHFAVLSGLTLHSSFDEHDFERVYTTCLNTGSCMSHPASKWGLFVKGSLYHPVRSYSFDEVCILWVTDSSNKIIGRVLGCSSTKQYSRIYYDSTVPNSHNKCESLLKEQGWTHNAYALSACDIAKVFTDDGQIICPYIDPGLGVDVDDDYLSIDGDYAPSASEGTLDWLPQPEYPCDVCGEEATEEYELTAHGELICSACALRHFTSVFDLRECQYTYARDEDSGIYTLLTPLSVDSYHLLGDDSVYNVDHCNQITILSEEYYGKGYCADADEVTCDVLTSDLDQFGLFELDGELKQVDEYRLFNQELLYVGPGFMEPEDWQLDFRSKLYQYPVLAYTV